MGIESSKRIAKNTMMLYIRMAIMLVIGLYTSRLVLKELGENDYGIYSVVGGIVTVLSFLNSSLSGATQRFLNFELGKGVLGEVKKTFKTSIQLHIGVSIIVLILAETIGLWFLNTKMNISPERMYAANWVYQFSVISCIVGIMTVPYNALIVAHEKMGAFSFISLIEIFLKLIIVIFLQYFDGDRLILYTGLILAIGLLNRGIYNYYCRKQFAESKVNLKGIDLKLMKSMASFSGWSVVGSLGYISHTQGIAIIINIFFGTIINAAEGITNQVNGIVTGFVGNFLTALNPQVVKLYAANQLAEMHTLILRGCRFSFYLVAVFALPILFVTPTLLNLWLTIVPPYTAIFIRITLLITLFNSFTSLLAVAQGATGKVKNYQITLTTIGLLHLPLAWLFFHFGYKPYWAMIIYLIIIIILQICRVWFVCTSTKLPIKTFIRSVGIPTLSCVALSFFGTVAIFKIAHQGDIISAIISEIILLVSIWLFGLTNIEKQFITTTIKNKLHIK